MDYAELINQIASFVNGNLLPDCACIGENKYPITKQDEVKYGEIVIDFDDSIFTEKSGGISIQTKLKGMFGIAADAKYEKSASGNESLRITIPVAYIFKNIKPEHKEPKNKWAV